MLRPQPLIRTCLGFAPLQSEELSRLQRRTAFLEQALSKERTRCTGLEEAAARAEAAHADAAAVCEAYESGVYGLPQVGWQGC